MLRTLFLFAVLGISPVFAQCPQFLPHSGEANALPPETREMMVAAEQKVGEARERYAAWVRAQPHPGYEWKVNQRHEEFFAARGSALEAVRNTVIAAEALPRYSRSIVSKWAKRARKQLNRRRPDTLSGFLMGNGTSTSRRHPMSVPV